MPGIVNTNGCEMDLISDAIDEGMLRLNSIDIDADQLLVNILKGNNTKWNDESEFDANKDKTQFRQYEDACDRVKDFYKEQHGTDLILRCSIDLRSLINSHTEKQTMLFNINVRVQFKTQKRARMSVWEAMEMLNTLVDESDPDVRCLSSPRS